MAGRISTGVKGLDSLMQGGYPENSVTVTTGPPGTGKTMMCLGFIEHGARNGQPGLYVTFEEGKDHVLRCAKKIGLDLKPLMKKKKIKLIDIDLDTFGKSMVDIDDLISHISDEAESLQAKRIAVDSLSSMINAFTLSHLGKKMDSDIVEVGDTKIVPLVIDDKPLVRSIVSTAIRGLKKTGCTTLLTSEAPVDSKWLSRDTISEFLVDGLIKLEYMGIGAKDFRSLKIVKLRETEHEKDYVPFEIDEGGITVREPETFKA